MAERKRTAYTKREIVLGERTRARVEEQAHERGVSFDAAAEAMLGEVLGDLERDKTERHPLFTEFFDRRVFRVHEEIEGAISASEEGMSGGA